MVPGSILLRSIFLFKSCVFLFVFLLLLLLFCFFGGRLAAQLVIEPPQSDQADRSPMLEGEGSILLKSGQLSSLIGNTDHRTGCRGVSSGTPVCSLLGKGPSNLYFLKFQESQ